MKNQYPETLKAIAPEIERVREALRKGERASVEANRLHAAGLGALHILAVFWEATGVGLGELKSFGQWWGAQGVTDPERFDAYAATLKSSGKAGRLGP